MGHESNVLGELVGGHVASEPRVSEEIVSGLMNEGKTDDSGNDGRTEESGHVLRDSGGTVFDPAIHATGEDGNPKRTPTGKWRKKYGGGSDRSGAPAAPGSGVGGNGTAGNPVGSRNPAANFVTQATAEAKLTSSAMFNIAQMFLGPEWKPTEDEDKAITDSLRDYYVATGVLNLPPWVGPLVLIGSYAYPRWSEMQAKKKAAKRALNDRGNDGKRKDLAGEAHGGGASPTG